MFRDMYKMIDELHGLVEKPEFVLMRLGHSMDNLSEAYIEFGKSVGLSVIEVANFGMSVDVVGVVGDENEKKRLFSFLDSLKEKTK